MRRVCRGIAPEGEPAVSGSAAFLSGFVIVIVIVIEPTEIWRGQLDCATCYRDYTDQTSKITPRMFTESSYVPIDELPHNTNTPHTQIAHAHACVRLQDHRPFALNSIAKRKGGQHSG